MYDKTRKIGGDIRELLKVEGRVDLAVRQTEPLASVQCFFSYQLFLFRGHCLSRNFFSDHGPGCV